VNSAEVMSNFFMAGAAEERKRNKKYEKLLQLILAIEAKYSSENVLQRTLNKSSQSFA
jgi:hypothetical protein